MEYQVALDPRLGVKVEEFIAAWNDSPEARQVATAQLHHTSGPNQYDPLTAIAIPILVGVVTGVTTDFISDLIKRTLTRRGVHQPVRIEVTHQPNGNDTVVVTLAQE
jgi:hypothetical protein